MMVMLSKNAEGRTVIEFEGKDLTASRVSETKKIVTEVIAHPLLKIEMKNVHECDSAGMQLLIFFFNEVENRMEKIAFSEMLSEMDDLFRLYGIQKMIFSNSSNKEKEIMGGCDE